MLLFAFILGLSGSVHCVAMCGPVVTVFLNGGDWKRIGLYHVGRLVTYLWLGLLFGIIGHSLQVGELQQFVSIVTGVVFVLIAFGGFRIRVIEQLKSGISQAVAAVYRSGLLPENRMLRTFLLGCLNGLMPCGLVYIAAISASFMATPPESVLFMTLFWIGTSPFLVLVSVIRSKVNLRWKGIRYASKIALFLLGAVLVIRGAALDIPYLSPLLDYELPDPATGYTQNVKTCH